MSKRRPDVQLTKDNYDRESDEEVEIYNEPKIASQEVLKSRPMVKAKRRLGSDNPEENGTSTGLFSGFKSSFGNNTFGNFEPSSFNTTTPTFGSFNAPTDNKAATATTIVENKSDNIDSNSNNHTETNELASVSDSVNKNESLFNANLTKLNQLFFDHIKKYIDSSMLYDFTVVCDEYISQYKKIKLDKEQNSTTINASNNNNSDNENVKTQGIFSFGEKTTESNNTFKIPTTFTFGQSLGTSGSTDQAKPQFSFGAGNPSLFGNKFATSTPMTSKFPVPATIKEEANTEGGEEGDAPPKVASVEHTEKDSIYTIKCKLYYQKDGIYSEKGIGFLYINVKDNSKPQLLIRANTTTGNILLNIALIESLPVMKAEKGKGVILTCIPNPEIEPKKKDDEQNGDKQTVTFFIRVKPSDCDELYDTIIKYKSLN